VGLESKLEERIEEFEIDNSTYIYWCLIQAWLEVFPIPGMKRSFFKLIEIMNSFRAYPINYAI